MTTRRVVVTGIGALTPIGKSAPDFWNGLISGKSGAKTIEHFDTEGFPTKFAATIPEYESSDYFDRKEARRLDNVAQYALVASEEAIKDSLYNPYTSDIHIYNNIYDRWPGFPDLGYDIGQLLAVKYGRNTPDIIYDGMQDPQNSSGLCIQNNVDVRFTNLDIEHNFEEWYSPFISNFSEDMTPHHCGRSHSIITQSD